MNVDTKKFLVSVADPLNLTLQTQVQSESRQDLGMALQGQLVVLRNRGYVPSIVYSDPQSAFRAMT
jgi:ribosomal protein L25 (general stress protein Ctc)